MQKRFFLPLGCLLFLSLLSGCQTSQPTFFPQTQTGRSLVSETSSSNEKRDLVEVMETIAQVEAPVIATFTSSGTILLGSTGAKLILREFFDYDCEYCRQFAIDTLPLLEDTYIRPGKMALELTFFPLSPGGENAAKAGLCAMQAKTFLKMHEMLIEADAFDNATLLSFANRAGMKQKQLRECLISETTTNQLKGHTAIADTAKIERVPTFVLGKERWIGLLTEQELMEKIDAAIQGKLRP